MWHVCSRSGVATLRTAIHLLLTYFCPKAVVVINYYLALVVSALQPLKAGTVTSRPTLLPTGLPVNFTPVFLCLRFGFC